MTLRCAGFAPSKVGVLVLSPFVSQDKKTALKRRPVPWIEKKFRPGSNLPGVWEIINYTKDHGYVKNGFPLAAGEGGGGWREERKGRELL